MPLDTFVALIIFGLIASCTPGPNNFMLMASGVNFGFVKTIPHMTGILGGFCVLLLAVGFGLGALLSAFPSLHLALKIAGASYLLFLAWKIATTREISSPEDAPTKPMTSLAAASFQWVNPKAWMAGVTAMSLYSSPAEPIVSVIVVAVAFTSVSILSVLVWTGFGMLLRQFLDDPLRLKWFNRVMGFLLALTVIPMVT